MRLSLLDLRLGSIFDNVGLISFNWYTLSFVRNNWTISVLVYRYLFQQQEYTIQDNLPWT